MLKVLHLSFIKLLPGTYLPLIVLSMIVYFIHRFVCPKMVISDQSREIVNSQLRSLAE